MSNQLQQDTQSEEGQHRKKESLIDRLICQKVHGWPILTVVTNQLSIPETPIAWSECIRRLILPITSIQEIAPYFARGSDPPHLPNFEYKRKKYF